MGFFSKAKSLVKNKYNKKISEMQEDKAIYNKALKEEQKKFQKEKGKIKVAGIREKAKMKAREGTIFDKIKNAQKKLKKRQEMKYSSNKREKEYKIM